MFSSHRVDRGLSRLVLAPMLLVLALGPAMPLAQAALLPGPDTLGAPGRPMRSYRPDLTRDADDDGVPDSGGTGGTDGGTGGGTGSGGGTSGGSGAGDANAAAQLQAALRAILAANDDGIPPIDTDGDGFSDYEEEFKKKQLDEAGVGLGSRIDVADASKRPPAYRYAIIDLGARQRPISISAKNGWVSLSGYMGRYAVFDGQGAESDRPIGVSVWHFGKVYKADGMVALPGISNEGHLLAMSDSSFGGNAVCFGLVPSGESLVANYALYDDEVDIYGNRYFFNGDECYFTPQVSLNDPERYHYRVLGWMNYVYELWASGYCMSPDGVGYIALSGGIAPGLLGEVSPEGSFSPTYYGILAQVQPGSNLIRSRWYLNAEDAGRVFSNPADGLSGYSGVMDVFHINRGVRLVCSSDFTKQAINHRMVAGGAYPRGHTTSLFFQAISNDGIAVGLDWAVRTGNKGKFMRFTQSDGVTDLPKWATTDANERRWVSINSPGELKRQIVVAGHQLWRRKLDPVTGNLVDPADFENPEDLRHLIEFSEPWLDLSATGVSDDGFIVGVGKKLIPGKQKPVAATAAAQKPFTDAKLSAPANYGPTDPEKCGLWDHDLAAYTEGTDYEEHAFMLIPIALRTDANRDGAIRADGSDTLGAGMPWRFWVNDDADVGDCAQGYTDIPGVPSAPMGALNNDKTSTTPAGPDMPATEVSNLCIHGRTDWPDWFPVYIDGKELFEASEAMVEQRGLFPTFSFNHPAGAVWVSYGKMDPLTAGRDFQTKDQGKTFGLKLDEFKADATAEVAQSDPTKLPIPQKLIDAVIAEQGHAIVMASAETRAPLRLSIRGVNNAGACIELAAVRLPLSVKKIFDPGDPAGPNHFFRWVNLRPAGSFGEAAVRGTNTATPDNWPDVITNEKHLVFVHGFNVPESPSTAWGAEVFKRLFWSGSRAKMTLVSWRGNTDEVSGEAFTYPNYQKSVWNAFVTSQYLAAAVNALPGDITICGHSLGNMVVTAAINDFGMRPKVYNLFDAAVPVEAYGERTGAYFDKSMSHAAEFNLLIPSIPEWANYPADAHASRWYLLWPESDSRSTLGWPGRFSEVKRSGVRLFNYYSGDEQVLRNVATNRDSIGGFWSQVRNTGFRDGQYSWVVQEWNKGNLTRNEFTGSSDITNQGGGWEVQPYRLMRTPPGPVGTIQDAYYYWPQGELNPLGVSTSSDDFIKWVTITPDEFNTFSIEKKRDITIFTRFADRQLHRADSYSLAGVDQRFSRAHLLACAVPANTNATGNNPLPYDGFTNYQMDNGADKTGLDLDNPNPSNSNRAGWLSDYQDIPIKGMKDGWVNRGDPLYSRWLHSDIKDVAYRFNYKVYDQLVKDSKLDKKQ